MRERNPLLNWLYSPHSVVKDAQRRTPSPLGRGLHASTHVRILTIWTQIWVHLLLAGDRQLYQGITHNPLVLPTSTP